MSEETLVSTEAKPVTAAETGFACPQCGGPVDMSDQADVAICAFCGSSLVLQRGSARAPFGDSAPAILGDTAPVVLRSVQCPQCAGPLGVAEGRRILACGHCGVRVVVKKPDGFSRWYFPVRLDRLMAAGAGSAWLKQHPGISKQARDAHFVEARLVWAPIWEYKALVAGWEFGSKLRTQYQLVGEDESARLDLRLVREGVQEPRLQERRLFQAATDLAALGATRPRITGREPVLPLLAGELDPSSQVLDAEGTAAAMVDKGRKAVLQPLSGATYPDAHLFPLRESTSLLFYPLWLLRYPAGNRVYHMVVNGRNGTVNSATAPAATKEQVMRVAVRAALMAVAVVLLVWLGVVWGAARAPMLTAAVIVSLVAILMVSRFRMQREVEYHEPFSS